MPGTPLSRRRARHGAPPSPALVGIRDVRSDATSACATRSTTWMDPSAGADAASRTAQWEQLRRTYLELGHTRRPDRPDPDLPDMVFAANGALVIGERVFGASFAYPQRRREADCHRAPAAARPTDVIVSARTSNEGEGDFLVVGDRILAGNGFRTDRGRPRRAAEISSAGR